jgi:hypothetical protein
VSEASDGVQTATSVLMVRPARFAHNAQTSITNRFQHPDVRPECTAALAGSEFEVLAAALARAAVGVCVVDDTPEPIKPDAVFPNNWVSFHRDGTVVLYPMLAPNRRLERRMEVLDAVESRLNFRRRRLLDLSMHEREDRSLEGTGSLVLDHVRRIAYACRSSRTDQSLLRLWAQQMEYEPVVFDAFGLEGTPIYHTNVLLSIGTRFAVLCTEAIADCDRARVLRRLREDREVIEITPSAMTQFAANVLELRARAPGRIGSSVLVMSQRAKTALRQLQNDAWSRLSGAVEQLVVVPVPTIENIGGGGVRCMLAEVPEISS